MPRLLGPTLRRVPSPWTDRLKSSGACPNFLISTTRSSPPCSLLSVCTFTPWYRPHTSCGACGAGRAPPQGHSVGDAANGRCGCSQRPHSYLGQERGDAGAARRCSSCALHTSAPSVPPAQAPSRSQNPHLGLGEKGGDGGSAARRAPGIPVRRQRRRGAFKGSLAREARRLLLTKKLVHVPRRGRPWGGGSAEADSGGRGMQEGRLTRRTRQKSAHQETGMPRGSISICTLPGCRNGAARRSPAAPHRLTGPRTLFPQARRVLPKAPRATYACVAHLEHAEGAVDGAPRRLGLGGAKHGLRLRPDLHTDVRSGAGHRTGTPMGIHSLSTLPRPANTLLRASHAPSAPELEALASTATHCRRRPDPPCPCSFATAIAQRWTTTAWTPTSCGRPAGRS